MVFLRTKTINGKEYYYLVKSVRNGKNIERYIGLNKPSKKDLLKFVEESDSTGLFLLAKKETLEKIKEAYQTKLKNASKDELYQIEDNFTTSFTYNTSRIEGSRLSLKETRLLLNNGITPGNKEVRDVKEVENHKKAWDFLKNYRDDLDLNMILELHKLLKTGISEDAGTFRDAQVRVGDMVGLNHKLIPSEIENLLEWYDSNKDSMDIIELVSEFHCTFERIHPFFDGNGRVGRLLMNHALIKHGFPPIIIYNKNKARYYSSLIKGQKGDYLYMVKYLVSELESQYKFLL